MNDAELLWSAIQSNPGEDTPKFQLADWYGDHERPDMLHAIKWCVQRGKWPRLTPKGTTALWYGMSRVKNRWLSRVDEKHSISSLILAAFPSTRSRRGEMRFKSLEQAMEHLASALDKLRQACEVKP